MAWAASSGVAPPPRARGPAQPAVGVQAQVVVLDLALQRGVHRIAQLFVTRQPDPALERLDVFPDRIEIDLVAAHQHQVKALAALVVDLRLVPQLLAIERIIGRPQLPVVVAQQVGHTAFSALMSLRMPPGSENPLQDT